MKTQVSNSQSGSNVTTLLKEKIGNLFDKNPYHELRNVRFETLGKTITLIGNVNSFFLKQLAQEMIRRETGDRKIINSITVNYELQQAI